MGMGWGIRVLQLLKNSKEEAVHSKQPCALIWLEHGLAQDNDEMLLGRSVAYTHGPDCKEKSSRYTEI